MKTLRASRDAISVRRFRLLADPTRLAVIELLLKGPRSVGEMNATLGLDQSLLSHHLKMLREEGLVQSTREGKAVRYRLAPGIQEPRGGKTINLGCCVISFDGKL